MMGRSASYPRGMMSSCTTSPRIPMVISSFAQFTGIENSYSNHDLDPGYNGRSILSFSGSIDDDELQKRGPPSLLIDIQT
jgi:hypothetical protein